MDDQADVSARPDRPEILVLRAVESVKRQPGRRRIHLQVEGRRFGSFLFLAGQLREAGGERIGDSELHFRHPPQPGAVRREPANETL